MGSSPVGRSDDINHFLQPVAAHHPFEEAVAQLAQAIRLGTVAVGDKLPTERELSEQLGISRPTLRAALRGLEQAGYVETRPGRFGGTFVLRTELKLTSEDKARALGPHLIETLDFRLAIGPGSAALAARNAEPEQVEQMRALAAAMEAASPPEFARLNCRLHILFAQAGACAPVLKDVSGIEARLMDALLAMPKVRRSELDSHSEHETVIDAIAAGDARAARDALEEHIAASDLLLRELAAQKRRGSLSPSAPATA